MPKIHDLLTRLQKLDKIQVIDYENPIPSSSKQIVTAADLIPIPKLSTEAKKNRDLENNIQSL